MSLYHFDIRIKGEEPMIIQVTGTCAAFARSDATKWVGQNYPQAEYVMNYLPEFTTSLDDSKVVHIYPNKKPL
jgi:hypothetical protein